MTKEQIERLGEVVREPERDAGRAYDSLVEQSEWVRGMAGSHAVAEATAEVFAAMDEVWQRMTPQQRRERKLVLDTHYRQLPLDDRAPHPAKTVSPSE